MLKTPNRLVFDDYAQFGNEVRQARLDKGLTQIDLAKKAGVGAKFVYELEICKPTVRLDKVFNVLDVLAIKAITFPRPAKRKK